MSQILLMPHGNAEEWNIYIYRHTDICICIYIYNTTIKEKEVMSLRESKGRWYIGEVRGGKGKEGMV